LTNGAAVEGIVALSFLNPTEFFMRWVDADMAKLVEKFGPFSEEILVEIRYAMANYGLACILDSEVAKEAGDICEEYENKYEMDDLNEILNGSE
jgi:hypothetical protein